METPFSRRVPCVQSVCHKIQLKDDFQTGKQDHWSLVGAEFTGGPTHLRPYVFISIKFLGKIGQIIGWRPFGSCHPPRNLGYTTEGPQEYKNNWQKYGTDVNNSDYWCTMFSFCLRVLSVFPLIIYYIIIIYNYFLFLFFFPTGGGLHAPAHWSRGGSHAHVNKNTCLI